MAFLSFVLLDQAALETEARITPLIHEKRKLFDDLLTLKGIHIVFFTAGLTPTLLLMTYFHKS
jgi:hypothetical protein